MSRLLRVLHINHGDTVRLTGGTAVATVRLHRALEAEGVDSRLMCKYSESGMKDVLPFAGGRMTSAVERLLRPLTRAAGLNDVHAISTFQLPRHAAVQSADVLHLHCSHEGYFNYLALPRLTSQRPAVYTMHDIWAFTGHCAIDVGCDRWKTGCGRCPRLDVSSAVRRDATSVEWRLKAWAYERSKMVIVSPSRWLDGLVEQSILRRFEHVVIPHGVDLQALQPRDTEACRRALGILPGKKVLLAIGSADRFKGGDLLAAALQALPASLRRDVVLLAMGDNSPSDLAAAGVEVIPIGFINGDIAKSVAFSAADVFVFPTRGEAFGLVALESIACGTPVAAFAVGGVPDVVRDGETGWLARPESPVSLASAIERLLAPGSQSDNLRRRAREVAEREFSIGLEARRYAAVYGKLVKGLPQGWEARGALVKESGHGNRQD